MVGLGLFAPLPLAVMIPFMAGQSFAMGEAFGKGFQYGKRRISSMTNEKFNSMSAKDHFDETTADITAMIPTMSKAIDKFHTLQTDIILKMIDYIAKLPSEVLPSLAEAPGLLVPQEFKINYPEEAARLIANINKLLGIDTTGAGKGSSAFASSAPPFQPPAKPRISTTTRTTTSEALKIAQQAKKSPSFIGPTQSQSGTSTANRLTVDKFGNVTNLDTRTPVVKKIRAPSSIKTQYSKYIQEIISINQLIQRTSDARARSTLRQRLINIKVAQQQIVNKYDLS